MIQFGGSVRYGDEHSLKHRSVLKGKERIQHTFLSNMAQGFVQMKLQTGHASIFPRGVVHWSSMSRLFDAVGHLWLMV